MAHVQEAIRMLGEPAGYAHPARYRSQVEFYAAALASSCRSRPWSITPGDFTDGRVPDFDPSSASAAWSLGLSSPWTPCFELILAPILERFSPSLLGISLTYRTQFLPGLALAAWLHARAASLPIAWGGPFLDSLPAATIEWLKSTGCVIQGPGEMALADLLGFTESADSLFRTPLFDGTDRSPYFGPAPVIPVTSTRGCYWRRCAFCAEASAPYHADDRGALFDRLDSLFRDHGPCVFHFTDNAIPPAVLSDLAHRGSPAPWWGFARPTVQLADPDFVLALARGGCIMLQLGLETSSSRLLELMAKGVDPSGYPVILDNLRRAGIKSYGYLLFGFPGETEDDRESTLAFCAAYSPDFLNASVFRLPPTAALAREPARFGVAVPSAEPCRRYWSLPGHDARLLEVRRWLSGRFLKHPAIRPAVSRTPRYYKSSHAPFL